MCLSMLSSFFSQHFIVSNTHRIQMGKSRHWNWKQCLFLSKCGDTKLTTVIQLFRAAVKFNYWGVRHGEFILHILATHFQRKYLLKSLSSTGPQHHHVRVMTLQAVCMCFSCSTEVYTILSKVVKPVLVLYACNPTQGNSATQQNPISKYKIKKGVRNVAHQEGYRFNAQYSQKRGGMVAHACNARTAGS